MTLLDDARRLLAAGTLWSEQDEAYRATVRCTACSAVADYTANFPHELECPTRSLPAIVAALERLEASRD